MEHKKWKYSISLPASIHTPPRSRKAFIQGLQTCHAGELPASTLGRLLETEGIAPSALTPDLGVELGRRLPKASKLGCLG
jgi:hypothetical protein